MKISFNYDFIQEVFTFSEIPVFDNMTNKYKFNKK